MLQIVLKRHPLQSAQAVQCVRQYQVPEPSLLVPSGWEQPPGLGIAAVSTVFEACKDVYTWLGLDQDNVAVLPASSVSAAFRTWHIHMDLMRLTHHACSVLALHPQLHSACTGRCCNRAVLQHMTLCT